ncbi:AraC family transcriptional regulator [Nocardioides sp. zg-1228]|uniref:helix-turn-helix domain-containing protein n=1 Tax=Nocardioides sp. zg-1228 TaxID=2763008 RepID=UPI0016426260|nr:AraC family transcriptional regulator [Nocardioides sp. zg-1228]MBC2934126.1 helix-turn-helix transcriptional regulator [Nocardioides sp. zg-1228]QSF58872.1 helix-turn-helix transcriptional regulator [Nocardioides sp. zg-1228]
MTTAADTFAAFLDALAETLDLGGEARARRLHLSRFHLTRVVSAAGGEAPERMRRRLLLERAAHRLITSDHQVVDIAFEAGFGSHEAFTRAFAREYGTPPSRWRLHPTRTQIEGASGVHFHPPGSLRLPTSRKVTPMDLVTRMIEHHIWLTGEMIERASRLTDEQLDAPIEVPIGTIDDDMTVRSVLGRLVGQLAQWNAAVDQRSYDWAQERGKSPSALRRELAEEGPAFLSQVRTTVEEGRLDDTFVDVTCETPRVFTYGGMVAHVLTFAAVRRLVVLGALEKLGIADLDAGDPMEWVGAPA